ncbi:neuromedin-U receptor 1-like [Patiria miniata]|uniref:G-protein coupled receptors family 1 profile domain-containing protein n=1 Tax=Patiria miniata TaxID=46514 RepID=A0A913ZQK0_PATMI|nr:neuromedin-U receptor 1-like [Patiria miniata]
MADAMTCDPNTVKDVLNLTDEADALKWEYPVAHIPLLTVVLPFLLLLGLFSNGTFLFVVFRVRWMRTIVNLYLVNLAVADLLYLSVSSLDKLGRYMASRVLDDQFTLGKAGCILVYFTSDTASLASLTVVTLISIERYQAICRPVRHRLARSWRRAAVHLATGWCVSLLYAGCLVPGTSVFDTSCVIWPDAPRYSTYPRTVGFCAGLNEAAVNAVNGAQTLPFFITLVINAVLFAKINKQLNRTKPGNEEPTFSRAVSRRQAHVRHQVSRMLLLNGVVSFLCLAPWEITSFSTMLSGLIRPESPILNREQHLILAQVMRSFVYLNSCINPLVYNAANSRYRKAFRLALCPCSRRKVEPANQPETRRRQVTSRTAFESNHQSNPR